MSELWIAATVVVVAGVASAALEKKPKVPGLNLPNPTNAGAASSKANLAALPDAQALATQVDTFNQGNLDKSFADIYPGYKDAARQAGSNISNQLAGSISPETSAAISRGAANRGVESTGTFGPRGRSLEARDFGTTSQALQQSGLQSLSVWLAAAKSSLIAPKFNVNTQLWDVGGFHTAGVQNEQLMFQRNNASNQIDAYYSGASRAGRAFSSVGGAAAGYLGAAGRGGGGSGGGGSVPYNYGNVDTMMNGPSQ